VLRAEGWLAVVYPGPDHLVELNERFGLMRQHKRKARGYFEEVSRFIGPQAIVRLCRRAELDGAAVRDVVLMGPNAHHVSPSIFEAETDRFAVTFDIVVSLARKSGAAS